MRATEGYMSLITAVTALVGALAGLGGFFRFKSKLDRKRELSEAFGKVATGLGGKDVVERLTSAALLSRFYDTKAEFNVADESFEKDAVRVCAAVLKDEPTGVVQKALSDGLAQMLKKGGRDGIDLQGANLRNAFWGARDGKRVMARNADLYRADASTATFRGADLAGTVFMEAQLVDTTFVDADLRGCNFNLANLRGARFQGARLAGATLAGAQHVPLEVAEGLDARGVYVSEDPVPPPRQVEAADGSSPKRVFVSSPSQRDTSSNLIYFLIASGLSSAGCEAVVFPPEEYGVSAPLDEVRRRISRCDAVVILGLPQSTASGAACGAASVSERAVAPVALPTPWNHIEAGIATGLVKPLLVERGNITANGVFDIGAPPHSVTVTDINTDNALMGLDQTVRSWAESL
ncbi:MAG: pentapeptide repeat-containing protein [Propionibacteriaceae bacterium]|jgi:hypothetical protein|nr:pentapeptide repeat-containing protein [Propionibacteriaceae bacterium]